MAFQSLSNLLIHIQIIIFIIKVMKNAEIKKLSAEELVSTLASEKEALARLKFAHAISPIENPLRIREARKVIARLETAISAAK